MRCHRPSASGTEPAGPGCAGRPGSSFRAAGGRRRHRPAVPYRRRGRPLLGPGRSEDGHRGAGAGRGAEGLGPHAETDGDPPVVAGPTAGQPARHEQVGPAQLPGAQHSGADRLGQGPRRIGDHGERLVGQRQPGQIGVPDLHVAAGEALPQGLHTTRMSLDREHPGTGPEQRCDQRAGTGPEVDDQITGTDAGGRDDAGGRPRIKLVEAPRRPAPYRGHDAPCRYPWPASSVAGARVATGFPRPGARPRSGPPLMRWCQRPTARPRAGRRCARSRS